MPIRDEVWNSWNIRQRPFKKCSSASANGKGDTFSREGLCKWIENLEAKQQEPLTNMNLSQHVQVDKQQRNPQNAYEKVLFKHLQGLESVASFITASVK